MPIPAIAAALVGLAGAGLGFWGAERQNKANKKEAQKQMDFQKEMSNTAAQRSVADYTAAGLNPALAYDRTASSPGGAAAHIEDAIGRGVSTGQAARALHQQLRMADQQNTADLRLKGEQTAAAAAANKRDTAASQLSHQQAIRQAQDIHFTSIAQPFHQRLAAAEALTAEYALPGAKNTADWETMVGKWGRAVGPAANVISSLTGMGRMLRAGKGVTNITRNITPTTIIKPIRRDY